MSDYYKQLLEEQEYLKRIARSPAISTFAESTPIEQTAQGAIGKGIGKALEWGGAGAKKVLEKGKGVGQKVEELGKGLQRLSPAKLKKFEALAAKLGADASLALGKAKNPKELEQLADRYFAGIKKYEKQPELYNMFKGTNDKIVQAFIKRQDEMLANPALFKGLGEKAIEALKKLGGKGIWALKQSGRAVAVPVELMNKYPALAVLGAATATHLIDRGYFGANAQQAQTTEKKTDKPQQGPSVEQGPSKDLKKPEVQGPSAEQGPPKNTEYTMKPGQTLSHVAKEMYKKPMLWPLIATENGIKDPRKMTIPPEGLKLKIPPVRAFTEAENALIQLELSRQNQNAPAKTPSAPAKSTTPVPTKAPATPGKVPAKAPTKTPESKQQDLSQAISEREQANARPGKNDSPEETLRKDQYQAKIDKSTLSIDQDLDKAVQTGSPKVYWEALQRAVGKDKKLGKELSRGGINLSALVHTYSKQPEDLAKKSVDQLEEDYKYAASLMQFLKSIGDNTAYNEIKNDVWRPAFRAYSRRSDTE